MNIHWDNIRPGLLWNLLKRSDLSNVFNGTEVDALFSDDNRRIENVYQSFDNEDNEFNWFENEQNFNGNCTVLLNCNNCFIFILFIFLPLNIKLLQACTLFFYDFSLNRNHARLTKITLNNITRTEAFSFNFPNNLFFLGLLCWNWSASNTLVLLICHQIQYVSVILKGRISKCIPTVKIIYYSSTIIIQ